MSWFSPGDALDFPPPPDDGEPLGGNRQALAAAVAAATGLSKVIRTGPRTGLADWLCG